MIQTRFPQCRLNLLTAFLIAATSATEQHQEAHPFHDPESPSEPNKIYRPNVIQYHISHIIITALPPSLSKPQIIMTPSLLLSGLTFRLVLALIAVSLLWGVYFWAVSA
ncbi:hypothetical protein ACVWQX_03445 [Neisseria meningitidis]